MALSFPHIDPIAFEIGPFAIRWYSLAYIAGFLGGIQYIKFLLPFYKKQKPLTTRQLDDFLLWLVLGVILGGRLGYVLFYNAPYYINHPTKIMEIWQGGMSFHGGLLGVIIAILLFSYKNHLPTRRLGDLIACAAPIGLFFGRIANFINGELWGRTTDLPWAIIFPHGGEFPRHPSQLYEAGLEGFLLFWFLFFAIRFDHIREKSGTLLGFFLVFYGFSRFSIEFVREPDTQLGFIWGTLTMGQILTFPMMLLGLGFIFYAQYTKPLTKHTS